MEYFIGIILGFFLRPVFEAYWGVGKKMIRNAKEEVKKEVEENAYIEKMHKRCIK